MFREHGSLSDEQGLGGTRRKFAEGGSRKLEHAIGKRS